MNDGSKAMTNSAVDNWSLKELGLSPEASGEEIRKKQLAMAKEQVSYAVANSRFYRERLRKSIKGFLADGKSDWDAFFYEIPPFSMADVPDSRLLWCLSASKIQRIVSLFTSGTTGEPKRTAFSPKDIERNIAFFEVGMGEMVQKGDKALCLLPGRNGFGVFDQLKTALARIGVELKNAWDDDAPAEEADCIVASPVQARRWIAAQKKKGGPLPGSILLSADYIPKSLAEKIGEESGADVYVHYGMTETCYGGGVSSGRDRAYHLRNADLFVEILDPDTLRPLPCGREGEVVITTLQTEGMPLIRYRTGDIGVLEKAEVPRIAEIRGRYADRIPMGNGIISIQLLDEILFSEDVIDYRAAADEDKIVLSVDGTIADEASLKRRICDAVGESVDIGIHRVSLDAGQQKRKIVRL